MPACARCGFASERAFRFCPECGAEQALASAREQRKTVTVLFCDLTGSTALGEALDPERLRAVLADYFERMKAIVERHGGTVEKFIGDAVMAVFGVPVVHEDDALRAIRAAAEMREALPRLGLQGRIGVTTGEVVTGTAERLATGDAVNVAARLEQAAAPGEVLIGEPTLSLVHAAVDVQPIKPLVLKGKSEPVVAYRLQTVHDAPERAHRGLFVGRAREVSILNDAWERVQIERRCELVTIIGDAGVGKSRLAAESLARIEATVARGRCLPYGDGITYWPVVEVLKQLGVMPVEEPAAVAIRSLLGETKVPTSPEEIAWAFRRTLERASAERDLVVVFDDIQWGEETFLDLIEHVALLSSDAPILLLCLARPELTERRPVWPVALRLGPLGDADIDELIPEPVSADLRLGIARAAGGNPLFIEEMLAMAGGMDSEVVVPPTLQALLAARLDQLDPAERSVLERGAIEGETFHRGAVQALDPEEAPVTPHLAALVRKGLIKPDRPQLAGEDGFRFRHLLIRDSAYDALPKAIRAELHERFALWLREHGAALVELDEIVGYHLERTCRYRGELGMPYDSDLAEAARAPLIAAGLRARLRADYRAASSLFARAAALAPASRIELAVETNLVEALFWAGDRDGALARASATIDRAVALDDQVAELCGKLQAAGIRRDADPDGAAQGIAALIEHAQGAFEAVGSQIGLYLVHALRAEMEFERGHMDASLEAYEAAAAHAGRAGLSQDFLEWRASCRFYGTTPVPSVLAWLDRHEEQAGREPWLRMYRALSLAMLGRSDEGRLMLAETRADLAERGGGIRHAVTTGIESAEFELLSGDPTAAAELASKGAELLEQLGDRSFLSSAAGTLARALYALDRLDEAEVWTERARELGGSEDAFTQMSWRVVDAKIRARRGDHLGAERLAREAVAIGEGTDDLNGQGNTLADLAEVLLLDGRTDDAVTVLHQAWDRYERKGNLVSAERAAARLANARDRVR